MNPISAVTLITAVGIGVEFTAHVVLAFLTSLGTREERMISCLHHMFEVLLIFKISIYLNNLARCAWRSFNTSRHYYACIFGKFLRNFFR